MVNVYVSSVIPAPIDQVWEVVKDFNGLPDWHPAIATSEIEGGGSAEEIGCVRNFDLTDGANIREELTALSQDNHSVSYKILESPMAMENYEATLTLHPVTNTGQTFGVWTASFDCTPENEADLVETVGQGVFQGGFDSLIARF